MKTIEPKFPNQSSIDAALSKLSEADRKQYNALLEQYNTEIQKPEPNHEIIADLITQAVTVFSVAGREKWEFRVPLGIRYTISKMQHRNKICAA